MFWGFTKPASALQGLICFKISVWINFAEFRTEVKQTTGCVVTVLCWCFVYSYRLSISAAWFGMWYRKLFGSEIGTDLKGWASYRYIATQNISQYPHPRINLSAILTNPLLYTNPNFFYKPSTDVMLHKILLRFKECFRL